MSDVLLRCPNCGTSRTLPGECEACHEADVRYFCTNHQPGLWLDGPQCTRCGARFGQPSRPPAPASASVGRRPGGPAPARARPPAGAAARATGAGRPARPAESEEIFGRFEGPARAPNPLEEMMTEAARVLEAGYPPRGPEIDPAPATRGLGGCLLRAVLLLFLFVMMAFGGMFLFAGSLFRIW